MTQSSNKKILYAASTASHLERFHKPYLEALSKEHTVLTMATGEGVDLPILFDKHFFSFSNWKSIWKIRKILKKEKFDLLLLHTTLAAFLIRAAMIGMRRRPRVLNVVHGYLFSEAPQGLKEKILLLCEKLLRKKTDEIAVMNAEDLRIAEKYRLCHGKVHFIYGMGVPENAVKAAKSADLRTALTQNGDFVCCFVGELSARKNQSFLIDAAALLRERGIPIKLILVGEGGERSALENKIAELQLGDSVMLAGSQTDVHSYLAASDLYVSASRSEGLPFNIMEAMAEGLPVVASATKGQTDLLQDSAEYLYPLGDIEAFCHAVEEIYHSRHYGAGSRSYPNLSSYLLSAVFDENLKILTMGLEENEPKN